MNRSWILGLGAVTLILAANGVHAEAGGAVRVYTNEDIERLTPLPSQPAPLERFDKERWEFVIQFLERERELLNADRNYDLARSILRAEVEAARDAPRYVLARAPHRGFLRRPNRTGGPAAEPPSDSFTTPAGERVVPLHARPSRARLHFDKATRTASN